MRRSNAIRLTTALGAVLLLAGTTRAQIDVGGTGGRAAAAPRAEEMVGIRMLADVERVVPGETFHLAVVFDIAPKWHIYWIEPGDGGAPTEVEVTAAEGFEVGRVLYPRPERIVDPEGQSLGYHRQVALFVPIKAPAEIDASTVSFDADIFYFVCKDVCLIGQAKQSIELRVGSRPSARGATPADGPARMLLEEYHRRLPAPFRSLDGAMCRIEPVAPEPNRRLVFTGPAAGFDAVELFPIDAPGVTFGATEMTVTDDRFRLAVDVEIRPRNALGRPLRLKGVVGLGGRSSDPSFSFDLPLEIDP